jgi:acyl carrier protein
MSSVDAGRPGEMMRVHTREQIGKIVTKAWIDILGTPVIGPADRFFNLGGDSMMAVMMVERVKLELGLEFPLESIFLDDSLDGIVNIFAAESVASKE